MGLLTDNPYRWWSALLGRRRVATMAKKAATAIQAVPTTQERSPVIVTVTNDTMATISTMTI